ncbi:MAG: ribokinase [Bacilli bacterium]|jgi:ribokinase|nr:ribokinase [Bacilli bacterium]
MSGKVCVFGAFNVDVVARLSRFPRPGESLIANGSLMGAGGKGANQALAAARAGAKVHYIGKIGTDSFAEFARNHLYNSEIDVCTLFESKEKPTGNALIYVSDELGENMIGVDPGANLTITDQEVDSCLPAIKSADLLLIQMENNADAIVRLLQHAHENKVFVILNPAPFQVIPDQYLALADLLTPNSTEAQLLTGVEVNDLESATTAASVLHAKGIKNVLITLGLQGALLSTPTGKKHIPAYKANPVDTTGAGDAFNGALAACLSLGEQMEDAALFASAFASVSVERVGAAQSIPTRQEAITRMQKYASLVVTS